MPVDVDTLDPTLAGLLAALEEDALDDTTWLILSDRLEEVDADTWRAWRCRQLVNCRRHAKAMPIPAAGSEDVWAAKNRLKSRSGLEVCRLWAILCVRYCPLFDGRRIWDLLKDERSRKAVESAEQYWCGLTGDDKLRRAHTAADAAAAYAAYAVAADAAYAADAAVAAAAVAAAGAVAAGDARKKARHWVVRLTELLPGWLEAVS